jgi:recombination protein RecT
MARDVAQPLGVYRDLLEKQVSNFLMVMPEDTVRRFLHNVYTQINDKVELRRCDPRSVVMACRRAAEDGLMLNGVEAALVPYKDGDRGTYSAQYLPMVQGIRAKVLRSGLISDVNAQVVFEGDEFDFALGDRPFIHHKKSETGGLKRPIKWVYSIATFKDGTVSREVMNIDEIMDIAAKSKARHGPWHDETFRGEMARKTCLKRHFKQLPQSSDIQAFWARLDRDETPDREPPQQLPPTRPTTIASSLDEFAAGGTQIEDQTTSSPTDASAPQTAVTTETRAQDAGITEASASETARAPDATDGGQTQFVDAIKRAYRRGQDDRRAGKKQDDMPTEYASNERNREQVAWWSGYDGKPMPSWSNP